MKASKAYEILVEQGAGYDEDICSIDEYIDSLIDVSDCVPEIDSLIFEVGLRSIKKYLKKIYKSEV